MGRAAAPASPPGRLGGCWTVVVGDPRLPVVGLLCPRFQLAGAAAAIDRGAADGAVLAGGAQDRRPSAPPGADASRLAETTGLDERGPVWRILRRSDLWPDQSLPEPRGEFCHPVGW